MEHADKGLVCDLLYTQQQLREVSYKFDICNKQTDLLTKIDELTQQVNEKNTELISMKKQLTELNTQLKMWKKKVEDTDTELAQIQAQLQESLGLNKKAKADIAVEKKRTEQLAIQMANVAQKVRMEESKKLAFFKEQAERDKMLQERRLTAISQSLDAIKKENKKLKK